VTEVRGGELAGGRGRGAVKKECEKGDGNKDSVLPKLVLFYRSDCATAILRLWGIYRESEK